MPNDWGENYDRTNIFFSFYLLFPCGFSIFAANFMYIEMKKIILTLLLLLCVSFQGQAVLKERDLNRTLHVLRLELHDKWIKQEESSRRIRERNQAQHTNLVNIMKRCQSTSLILYSQGRE